MECHKKVGCLDTHYAENHQIYFHPKWSHSTLHMPKYAHYTLLFTNDSKSLSVPLCERYPTSLNTHAFGCEKNMVFHHFFIWHVLIVVPFLQWPKSHSPTITRFMKPLENVTFLLMSHTNAVFFLLFSIYKSSCDLNFLRFSHESSNVTLKNDSTIAIESKANVFFGRKFDMRKCPFVKG
jgi:hypothetical protein